MNRLTLGRWIELFGLCFTAGTLFDNNPAASAGLIIVTIGIFVK